MSNLNSYNILINRFKAFAEGHFLLKNFTYGAITLADLQKFGLYPFMHIVPVDVSYETGVKNFSFDVFFADLPRDEENKAEYQKETLSDLQRIAEDLLGEITNHRVLFGYDCSVVSSRLVPFEEEFSNVLTGWNLSITLQIPYQWSACDTPASFNDFIIYNQSTGESSVLEFKDSIVREGGEVRLVNDLEFPPESYYYGTDANGERGWFTFPTDEVGLTCETLGACSTIIDIQTNITNLENDVEDLSANIVDVQMDITTIEGNITTLQSDVSDLETEVGLKANTSDISAVGFSNDYNDLDNLPTIPDSTSDLINDSGFITIADVPAQVNADWNATTGDAQILNKPAIPTYSDFIEDAINNGVINKAPSENAVFDALALKFNIPTGLTSDYLDGLGTPTPFPESLPTSTLRHEVKLGSTMTKGTPVYVSGADGTNMIVSPASNTTEQLSSKTLGLLLSGGNTNAKVFVITEGLLSGLNTSTATIGDAVWLGSNGTLIYGLANKPVAPLHLVFIGIVTRVNINNGEIFVKVQNGFELQEIHNVLIQSVTNNQVLQYESATSLWKNKTLDKTSVGLSNVDNTSDANKPVSTATQTALNLKQDALGFTPVPTTRTLTINGTSQDLSVDRTFTIATGLSVGTTPITSGTIGRVLFEGTGNVLQQSANLFWDNTNGRLGIGTATPAYGLDVNSTARFTGSLVNTAYFTSVQRLQFNNGNPALNIGLIRGVSDGVIRLLTAAEDTFSRLQFGGGTTAFPALQRSGAALCVVDGTGTGVANLLIGTTTDAGFKLDVNGTTRLNGLSSINGAGVANTALAVYGNGNGAGNYLFRMYDASSVERFYLTASGNFRLNGATDTGTTGDDEKFRLSLNFTPTSGTRTHQSLYLTPTINQTGGANGITRGLYINPTLTAAADFRAIEVTNGVTVLAPSVTARASLRIPSGTAPTSPVNGDIWFDGTNIQMRIGGVTRTFTLI